MPDESDQNPLPSLPLTAQEAQGLLQLLDLAVRQGGGPVVANVFHFQVKLQNFLNAQAK